MKATLAAALLSSLLLVACDQSSSPPPPKAPAPAIDNTLKQANDAAKKAADTAQDAVKKAADTVQEESKKAADAAKDASDAAGEAAKKAADADVATATADAAKEAQSWMEQVTTDIRAKKFDSAETALKKLEEIKASLPADLQGKINSLRDALTAAKTADSLKVPDAPMK